MHRLYAVIPDTEMCKRIVAELKAIEIPERHLHVTGSLAKNLKGLPQATVWQNTELVHGLELGAALGGIAGLIGGGLAVVFPPAGSAFGDSALFAAAIGGAVLGGVVSAMIGSHEHNHSLDRFRADIRRGRLLLIADVPHRQLDAVQALICEIYPKAEIIIEIPK